jgi:hypothetical protein
MQVYVDNAISFEQRRAQMRLLIPFAQGATTSCVVSGALAPRRRRGKADLGRSGGRADENCHDSGRGVTASGVLAAFSSICKGRTSLRRLGN